MKTIKEPKKKIKLRQKPLGQHAQCFRYNRLSRDVEKPLPMIYQNNDLLIHYKIAYLTPCLSPFCYTQAQCMTI